MRPTAAQYAQQARSSQLHAATLRLATHNVDKGVHKRDVCPALLREWQERRFDVVAIQETRTGFLPGADLSAWHHDGSNFPGGVKAGVAMLWSRRAGGPVQPAGSAHLVYRPPGDFRGRVLGVPLNWAGHRLFVVAVYAPNDGQAGWLRRLLPQLVSKAREAGDRQLVLLGDWNFVESVSLDRRAADGSPPQPSTADLAAPAVLRAELPEGTVDAYRELHPSGRETTYFSRRWGSRARLDRAYLAPGLRPFLLAAQVGNCAASDHAAAWCDLAGAQVPEDTRGWGLPRVRMTFWACRPVRAQYEAWLAAQVAAAPATAGALLAWWPAFKRLWASRLRHFNAAARDWGTQQPWHSQRLAARADMDAAWAALDAGGGAPALTLLKHARAAWLRAVKAEGAAARADGSSMAAHPGELPCPALSAVLRPRPAATTVSVLRHPDSGRLLAPGPGQAQAMAVHLARISSAPAPSEASRAADQAALAGVLAAVAAPSEARLGSGAAAALDSDSFQPAEVLRALRRMRHSAAPGLDGLPVDAYKRGRHTLAPLLARLFAAMAASDRLPDGFLDGVVVSLYKDGERSDPSNYRPITLLGVDYRLLARVLCDRLLKPLGSVIGCEQAAFLPGRLIGDSAWFLQLWPYLLEREGRSAAVVFLDQRKAFDTVDRGFLLAVMEQLGFGPGFRGWVRRLLGDTRACAVLNGHRSSMVSFTAGVRQGCPLSPALFLCVNEAFLRLMRVRGLGVMVAGQRVVAQVFADDIQVLVESADDVHRVMTVAQEFAGPSNQRASVAKTVAMLVGAGVTAPGPGATAPGPDGGPGLRLVASADAFGYSFPCGVGEAQPKKGWGVMCGAAEAMLGRLSRLNLSAFGRASAANAYALGGLLYHAELCPLPPALHGKLVKRLAALVDRGGRQGAFAGVRAALLPGHPSTGGFGLLPLGEHVTARLVVRALRLLLWAGPPAAQPLWMRVARALLLPGGEPSAWRFWVLSGNAVEAVALPPPLRRLLGALDDLGVAPPGPVTPGLMVPRLSQLAWAAGAAGPSAALAGGPGAQEARRLAELSLSAMVPGAPEVPLGRLTVRGVTAALLAAGEAGRGRRHKWLRVCEEAVGGLAARAALDGLSDTLAAVWRLRWANTHKTFYWRFLLDGLPLPNRMGQAGVRAAGDRCCCERGFLQQPGSRKHVFWGCWVAQRVVQEVAHCLAPPGGPAPTLTRANLWLLQPPPGVQTEAWWVVGMAALQAMWQHRLLSGQPPYALRRVPPPAAHARGARAARQRRLSDAHTAAVVAHAAAAVDTFWGLLEDFAVCGFHRGAWRRLWPADHPFLHFPHPGGPLRVRRV